MGTLTTIGPERNWKLCVMQSVVRVASVERIARESGGQLPQQLTDSMAILLCKHGEGILRLDGRELTIRGGRVYVCPAGRTFGIERVFAAVEVTLIRFELYEPVETGVQLTRAAPASFDERAWQPELSLSEEIARLSDRLYEHWTSEEELERFRCAADFQTMLYLLLKQEQGASRPDYGQDPLTAAKAYIDEHFEENVSADQLATIAGLSAKYFMDAFKKRYGQTTADYIAALRMSKAKRLMTASPMLLRDIAHEVGYQDEFYFSRKFKRYFGVSPSLYLANRRRKIASYSNSATGILLALGITPYAAPLHPKWGGYYMQRYGNEIPLHLSAYRYGADWEANVALLRGAPPDLILCEAQTADEEKAQLASIAPVHYLSGPWRERLRDAAALLGEEPAAKQWLADYERHAEASRKRIEPVVAGHSFLVLRFSRGQFSLYARPNIVDVLYGDLGLTPAYPLAKGSNPNEAMPLHAIQQANADHILLMVRQEEETLRCWQAMQAEPGWNDLTAVRHNRVHLIPSEPWLEYSPVAHERVVNEMVAMFAAP
ncbi:AraC family transcriptional regulator [Paenibacillus methanolicus]|uniref:ABC-type Fe3+-hydroxamate transport system substrate-binding protein n=1 Tax=Paenibacillus methanolicus TaxID=582686 RepID=A0A5S5C364_9BACL|nr:helix-turn-helix domain-containing protein [Paenibacillus methanolicus]TYP72413.1 ABC-type Fe3+-hydroxamate transport system substrate-binding protein [Paenibacillus methanolicus]